MSFDLAVIGLGHVGLALAKEASHAGLRVLGYDVAPRVIEELASGRSHVSDVPDADVVDMLAAGFVATTGASRLSTAETIVICVPTPLGDDGGPQLEAVTRAATVVSRNLRPNTLVVLESTAYPGTTAEVVAPVLEQSGLRAGLDFNLAFSPERIDPGNTTFTLRNTPKVVGGHTSACADAASVFYGKFVNTVLQARGTREAEMTKLLENTYRHVNIALVNEMTMFCNELGIDLWNAISCASTKPFGFQPFYPSAGVGGHCIPIDPSYLAHRVSRLGYPFRFVELAREINAGMPGYVVRRAQDTLSHFGKTLQHSTVLLLGVTYKPDVNDVRETPATPIARRLRATGARVIYHDPYVHCWTVDEETMVRTDNLHTGLRSADLALLLQSHSVYDTEGLALHANLLFDACGHVQQPNTERL